MTDRPAASWPPRPVRLENAHARLEPLEASAAPALAAAARDGNLWELWYTSVPHPDQVDAYIARALEWQAAGNALPFQIYSKAAGAIVGSTRYCNMDPGTRRLEIGYTWYAERTQRTALNTACKLLLLAHAFEVLGCIAVELRTHWFNFRSREAIAGLGAKQDGVLRNHQIVAGVPRDTVVFSITDAEWPAVKKHLEFRLARLARAK